MFPNWFPKCQTTSLKPKPTHFSAPLETACSFLKIITLYVAHGKRIVCQHFQWTFKKSLYPHRFIPHCVSALRCSWSEQTAKMSVIRKPISEASKYPVKSWEATSMFSTVCDSSYQRSWIYLCQTYLLLLFCSLSLGHRSHGWGWRECSISSMTFYWGPNRKHSCIWAIWGALSRGTTRLKNFSGFLTKIYRKMSVTSVF